jgi:transcriptional regulator of met regulon
VISSNKHAPATAKSNVQIAKVIERVKQNPPIENASGEMPGNDKPEEQKISATIPKALPGVDYSASEKDQTTHSNKEPKTNEPQIQIKPFPPPGTSTEQKIDVKDIQNLFEVGLKSQSGSWEDAKERFEAICKRGEDPRLYYAWGIVCLYRNRNEEALNAFQKSTQTDRLVYLPAWQILARTQALKGQYNETLETLVRLARVLEQDAKWPDEQSRIECASWCGWMMAFFQAIGKKSEKIKTAAAQCNMEILSILSGKRRMSYEDGVKYAMDQPPIVAINAHHTTMSPYIERQLAEQDKKLKNVQDKKDKLKHKAQKDEEEYKNGKDQIEKKGAELETTYKNLTSQCDALQKNIPQLEQQRSNVKSQWDISHANNLAVQNIQLTNAINTQQAFLSTAQKQADQVKRQGLDLVKARDLLTVQYQQTSQQSLAQIEQLEKLVNSIEDKIKKLKNT